MRWYEWAKKFDNAYILSGIKFISFIRPGRFLFVRYDGIVLREKQKWGHILHTDPGDS